MEKAESLEEMRLSPTLLLFSGDDALVSLVLGIVKRPWKLVRQGADEYIDQKIFAWPNVQLIVLDDQAVKESERSWLLAQIRRHLPGIPLLYVAGNQSDGNEKQARTNGAHYYVSKPLVLEGFGKVLRSFLQVQTDLR